MVAMWTAIETLAGDLWTAAVNAHPSELAKLKGSRHRISRKASEKADMKAPSPSPSAGRDEKLVGLSSLLRVSSGTCDLRKLMGKLLREKCDFSTLGGIREAYSVAFNEGVHPDGIDAALGDGSFRRSANTVRKSARTSTPV